MCSLVNLIWLPTSCLYREGLSIGMLIMEAIESGIGVGCYLELLNRELQDKIYQANPVRRVMMPKADGS